MTKNESGYAELFDVRAEDAFYGRAAAARSAARGATVKLREVVAKVLGIDETLLGLGPVAEKHWKTVDGIDFGAASALSTMPEQVKTRALKNLLEGGFDAQKLVNLVATPLARFAGRALDAASDLARGAVSKARGATKELLEAAGVDESFNVSNIPRKTLGVVIATTLAVAIMMAGEAKGQVFEALSNFVLNTESAELNGIQGMNLAGYANLAETAAKAFGPLAEHIFGEPATAKPSFYDAPEKSSFYDSGEKAVKTMDEERAEMLEMARSAAKRFMEEDRNNKREVFEASLENMSNRVFVDNIERAAADFLAVKHEDPSVNRELVAALYTLCEQDENGAKQVMEKFGASPEMVGHLVMEDADLRRVCETVRGLTPEQFADTMSFMAGVATSYAADAGQEGPVLNGL